jgi:hypothetical protein
VTQSAARGRLFVASYAPLFLILAVRFNTLSLRLVCASVAVLGASDAWLMTRRAHAKGLPVVIRVTTVDDVGAEVGGYLASYLLPFVVVQTPTGTDLIGYFLFLLVALVVYVRSDLVRVNPTFYLLGYRVLRVGTRTGAHRYLLTRQEPETDQSVRVVDIAGIVMAVGASDADG